MTTQTLSRRSALKSLACGFGSLALADMLNAGGPQPHHAPKAKRVIFIFMQGGPSQVDTFDYKPRLAREDGQMRSFQDARTFARDRTVIQHRVMKNLWRFRQYGQSGKWVSDLFPHIGRHADDICFLQGMHTEGIAHGPATLFMHTGSINLVRPSVGAWTLYGLGTENQNLPGFITICPSMGNGGPRNWSNASCPRPSRAPRLAEPASRPARREYAISPIRGGRPMSNAPNWICCGR